MEEKIIQDITRIRKTMMRVSKRMLWRYKLLKIVQSSGGYFIELYSMKQYAESTGRNREYRCLVRERDVVRRVTALARENRVPLLNILLPGEEEHGVVAQTAE